MNFILLPHWYEDIYPPQSLFFTLPKKTTEGHETSKRQEDESELKGVQNSLEK